MIDLPYVSVLLLAGGLSSRMQSAVPKQFLFLKEKIIALHSFELFTHVPQIKEIIVVAEPMYCDLFPKLTSPHIHFASPGRRRQDSVYNGLMKTSPSSEFICIHDSARPLLVRQDLENLLAAVQIHHAAALAVPVKNTIKESDSNHIITRTFNRSSLWEMHTPQAATPKLLRQGFTIAHEQQIEVTDDAALVELTGHPVKLVLDSYRNIKITTPEDLLLAELLS